MSEEVKKSEEIEISIMDLVKAVISRIWMVALSFLVFVLLVVVYLLNATPVYEVTERIMVQSSEKSSDLSSLLSLSGQSTDIQNDIEILTSKSTFQMALDSLDLDNYVSENGEKYSELDIKVEDLRLGVNISVVEDTNFVEISFKHSNPAFAEDFVSALVEQFSNRMLEMSKSSAYSQLDFIESQIAVTEENLADASLALSNFQKDNQTLQLSERATQILRQLSYYSLVRSPLEKEMDDARDKSNNISLLRVSSSTLDNLLSDYRTSYAEILLYDLLQASQGSQGTSSSLSQSQMERYYVLSNRNQDVEHQIEAEIDILREKNGIEDPLYTEYYRSYIITRTKIDVIDESLASLDLELETMPDLEREMVSLQSKVDVYSALALKLMEMQSETELISASITNTVQIIDAADATDEPVSPKKAQMLLLGGMLGIFIGCGTAILLSITDKRIKTRDDLQKIIGNDTPVLGWIPLEKKQKEEGKRTVIELVNNPMSLMSERYKHIASAIMYGKRLGSHAITVCSPGKSDGKTTVLLNIAYSLALSGKRVLVIDMDLRRPNIENTLEITHSDKGISDLLCGRCSEKDVIRIPYEKLETFHVIGAGSPVAVPSVIIQTDTLNSIVSNLSKYYDFIFFDAPPLQYASEILTIVRSVPEVIVVARSCASLSTELEELLSDFEQTNVSILGAVLNGLPLSATSISVNRYGYSYGYGNASEDAEKHYVKSMRSAASMYKKSLKMREKVIDKSSFYDAPLAYKGEMRRPEFNSEGRKKTVHSVIRNFESYLSEIENDENARGKKE